MGFGTTLLIAYPSRGTQGTTWFIRDAITFGRVTRLEKLVGAQYRHINFGSREKAGICATSCIFRHLAEDLRNPQRAYFAAPFDYMWIERGESCHEKGDYVQPVQLWPSETCLPTLEKMRRHNEVVGQPDQELFQYTSKCNLVIDPLLMWKKCGTVAQWLKVLLRSQSQSGRALRQDPVAYVHVRAWQSYLEEIAKLETKAIFLFEEVAYSQL